VWNDGPSAVQSGCPHEFREKVKRFGFIVVKNAAANVLRGGASAIVAVVLPPFLTRSLSHDRFAAWALLLQFAAYVNLLDFGLQTAVSRYVARSLEQGAVEERNRIISTAFALLSVSAFVGYLAMCIVVPLLPAIFRGVSPDLLVELKEGVLCLSAFSALGLPASTFTGVLLGMHRNEFTTLAFGSTKLLGAATLIVFVRHTQSLVVMAVALGTWNLLGGLAQYLAVRKLLPDMKVSPALVRKTQARELFHYCAYLNIWAFGGFLASGLDLLLVGYFDFKATGYYSIATSVVNFLGALNTAIFGAMIPAVAILHTRGEFRKLGLIVLRTTRYGIYLIVLSLLPFAVAGKPLLKLWLGADYALHTLPLLGVLLIANAIRFSGNPYSVVMIGSGQHKYAIVSPFAEGLVNLAASILCAMRLGGLGVAVGTLIGSFVGLGYHIFYNVPRTREIEMSKREYAVEGLLSPLLRFAPLLLACLALLLYRRELVSGGIAVVVAAVLSLWSVFLVVRLEGWWPRVKKAA
jgi:O-antigen/teichoic acid export membrane protein